MELYSNRTNGHSRKMDFQATARDSIKQSQARPVNGCGRMRMAIVQLVMFGITLSSLCPVSAGQLPFIFTTPIYMLEQHMGPMMELKENLDKDLNVLTSWNSSRPCNQWLGVTCDAHGYVTAIVLSDYPSTHSDRTLMTPTIANSAVLHGSISDSIGQLHTMRALNLNGNQLVGPIPSTIGNLTDLLSLDLSFNNLSGPIPITIASCQDLVIVDLHSNNLTGSIPSFFGNFSELYQLSLRENNFSGKIPYQLGNLKQLAYLDLGSNDLDGRLPAEIGRLPELIELWLEGNILSGPLPDLSALHNLQSLRIGFNAFEGGVPSLNSTWITEIDLTSNRLAGNLTFPSIPSLQKLLLSDNRLNGSIPDFVNGTYPDLQMLDLSSNQFEGPIPSGFAFVPALENIHLGNNSLTGELLPELGGLKSLQVLDLSENLLTGSIPETFGGLTTLEILNLEANQLSGSLDVLVPLTGEKLTWLFLGNNSFSGSLDASQLPNNKPTFDLRLYNNPVCSTSTNFISTTYCQSPQKNAYESSLPCPQLDCLPPYLVDFALFAYNGSCACVIPVRIRLRLTSPPFNTFSNQTVLVIRQHLAKNLNLSEEEIFVKWAVIDPNRGHLVNISISAYGPRPFSENEATYFLNVVNDPRFPFDPYTGSFSRYAAYIPSLPNTAATYAPPPASPVGVLPPKRDAGFPFWAWLVVILGGLLALGAIIGAYIAMFHRHKGPYKGPQSSFALRVEQHFVKALGIEEIQAATKNFDDSLALGDGGFGTVYRGVSNDGVEWAVKRAKLVSMTSLQEFQNEVDVISRMSHANLVRLLGYCDEANEQILVYEFMPGGTLRDHLRPKPGKEKPPLSFEQRLEIALGAAEGLRYLHTFAKPTIIHRDVKSENILLDHKLEAKVADFGLLKDVAALMVDEPVDEEKELPVPIGVGSATKVAGTPGYIDPEYYTTYRVTAKSDVYSFGVVLLELITGLSALVDDPDADEEEPTIIALASWVPKRLRNGSIHPIVDARLDDYPEPAMEGLTEIALNCLRKQSKRRPEMAEVAAQLRAIKTSLQGGYASPESRADDEGNKYEGLEEELSAVEMTIQTQLSGSVVSSSTNSRNRHAPVSVFLGGR